MPRLLAVAALLLAVLLLAALRERPLPRADFAFINRGDVSTLDPAQMSWSQDFRVARLLFEGLTTHDVFSDDYAPLPGVAERWEVSADGLTYTFHLRHTTWSDGTPLTAADFIYSWRRTLLPDSSADYAKLLHLIRGGRAFAEWRSGFPGIGYLGGPRRAESNTPPTWLEVVEHFDATVGLHAPDPHTLIVELERPTPYFLDLTGFPAFFPLPAHLLAAHESIDATGALRTDPAWTKPGRIVTNGPFTLARWRFKRDMRFEKSSTYWNAANIALNIIEIPSIADGNAQVLAFRTGAVDWTSDITPFYRGEMFAAKNAFLAEHASDIAALRAQGLDDAAIAARLPADPRNHVHAFPSFGTYFYNFNCAATLPDDRKNPFADPRVRRAFAISFDRAAITSTILRGGETPASTLIPPGSIAGYASPPGLATDPAAARALLADAGFPGGRGLPTIELLFNTEGGHDLIAQSIARDWERTLGVGVRLAQKEIKVFREDVKSGNFMISRATWFGDYGDPTTFLDINRTGDGNNDRRFSLPAYDALLTAAESETDPARRYALLADAERLLLEEAPIAPIYRYVQQYLYDPRRITGISPHPRQEQNLYLVRRVGE